MHHASKTSGIHKKVLIKMYNTLSTFVSKHEYFCLIVVFLIYLTGAQPSLNAVPLGDTFPAELLPFSIFEYHTITFDPFQDYIKTVPTPYMFVQVKDHYLSYFPIVTPVLMVPFYFIPYLLMKILQVPIDIYNPGFILAMSILDKIMASIITSLAVFFIYKSGKLLLNDSIALAIAFIFGFATSTWSISSQTLWQHGLSELLLSVALYCIISYELSEKNRFIVTLGLCSGLFIFNRPSDSLLLVPVLSYIFLKAGIVNWKDKNPKIVVVYLSALITAGVPFVAYNLYYFRTIFGGYSNGISSLHLYDFIVPYLALLFSPSRGLFIFSPVLAFSIIGYFSLKTLNRKTLEIPLYIAGFACIITIFVYSTFNEWWAGWSYGPRFMTGLLPYLVIFIGIWLKSFENMRSVLNTTICVTLLIAISWSVFVQIVGVYWYPNGDWNSSPVNVDTSPDRVWDFEDSLILRTFMAGHPHIPDVNKIGLAIDKISNI